MSSCGVTAAEVAAAALAIVSASTRAPLSTASTDGSRAGRSPTPITPSGSAYLRRWSIDPLPDSRNIAWILQVLVTDIHGRSVARFTAAKMGKAS